MARPTVDASTFDSTSVTAASKAPAALPAHTTDDLIVLCVWAQDCSNTGAVLSLSGGSLTWTPLFATLSDNDGKSERVRWYAAKATSASETVPTASVDVGTAHWIIIGVTVSGWSGTIGDITTGSALIVTQTAVNATLPSATVATADSLALRGAGVSNDRYNASNTPPITPEIHAEVQGGNDGGPNVSAAVCQAPADPSSITSNTWTSLWTADPSQTETHATIVIPPAAAGGISIPAISNEGDVGASIQGSIIA